MILALIAGIAIFVGGVLVGRKATSVTLSAELAKIENVLSADEKVALAKVKALLHIS